MQDSPDRDGAGLDLGEVFADPAFAAPKARGAAFAVVRPGTSDVLWANRAAAAQWGAADPSALAVALFGQDGRDGGWLDGIVRGVLPGRPAQLARGGLARGFRMRARTALIRAWAAPDGTLLMGFAVPDSAAVPAASPDAWRQAAWPADAPGEAGPAAFDEGVPDAPAPDAEAGPSLARRSQVAVLRDRLNHAVDGAPALRLLWRTDADDAVTQIDAATFARLGSPLRFDRRTWSDIVAGFDPAGAERLRTALATRATWSGITLALPVADAVAVVPMALSASPVFGPDRRFTGFRGFGTVDLGQLDLAPPRAPAAEPVEDGAVEDGPEPAPETAVASAPSAAEAEAAPVAIETHDAPSRQDAEAAAPDIAAALPAEPVPAAPPANVVHLRAFQALLSGRAVAAPVLPPLAEPAEGATPADDEGPRPDAPLNDDLAFLALGEALRARIGAPPRTPERGAEPDAEPARLDGPPGQPAPVGVAPAGLLDQLPMGLLATVGSRPVFANAAAAARLGFAAPAALLESGAPLVAIPSEGVPALHDAQGRPVTIPVRRVALSWEGAVATLWILGEAEAAPVAAPPVFAAPAGDEAEAGAGELLDRIDDAVALLDGNGRLRRLNRRGEGWFGRLGPEDAPGRNFTQLLAPESRPVALSLLGEVRSQRDGLGLPPLNRDVLARTGDPMPVPMLLTMGRLGASGFYATLRDVTALRRAETERARTERDQARDADRLPDLLAKVSHEIRTPLNAILGFAEVMMDERFGPLGNPRYRDYLKDIHASGTQVVTMVSDLLDLSRIEAGHLDLDVAAVDVNRIVAETVAQMQPEAHRERVIMRTSLGGRIPSVLADERSARQIVRNLLSNAVKFNEPGGQVIVSTALSEAGTVLLRVRDTGVGMTEAEITAALEPFGGAASLQPANGNGNGLGLPLTRALVGANGASMAIRSRPREGTLVEVAFTSAGAGEARRPA